MAIEFLATMRSSIFEGKIFAHFFIGGDQHRGFDFSSATAQEINEYLTIGPTADWVELIDRPTQDFVLGNGRDINYLLVDKQLKYSDTDAERYARYVEQLLSPNAVERSSTISVDFDPAYQTVAFHRLLRIRDGEETDILDPSRFGLFRIETDREKLIYNGTLQLSYLIPDVRVGDVLDYSLQSAVETLRSDHIT
ncbi:DUF3857 domain-containing protein [Parasedimentitalea maritima]|uniref:DUF3857 domain-containing protein n=1 Tax=Parasedimentitalea maritima TaxID=2578117 RepID=A0A6A4RDL2_9RHOB|nr:DUF3857 domain-containing protein [Zongyanglinia marina]KAE9628639.1 DUF3857 domain-containing protein [Zongyanglinia marina]